MAADVAVFADTNLGTHIAFNASPDITAGELKRVFEKVHFTCLPDIGEIQVNSVMVKRKSCFYCLSDSLPLKYVFPRMSETWFLHVEVMLLNHLCGSCSPHKASILSKHGSLMTRKCENSTRCNSEEKIMEGFHPTAHVLEENEAINHVLKEKTNSHEDYMHNEASGMPERPSSIYGDKPTGVTAKSQHVMQENKHENMVELHANSGQGSPSKMSTQVRSVTGIINKYFSSFNGIDNVSSSSNSDVTSRAVCSEIEVQSNTRSKSCSKRRVDSLSQFTPKISKRQIDSLPPTPKTPPHVLHTPLNVNFVSKSSGSKHKRSSVGKCLLSASKGFRVSATKHSPSLSFCRFKNKKRLEDKSQINGSIFSFSGSESDD